MIDQVKSLRAGFLADTHDERQGLMERAVEHMGDIDFLFHLGDFLNNLRPPSEIAPYQGYLRTAERLIKIKRDFGLKGIGLIPGNHDFSHPEKGLCELEEFSIHKTPIEIEGCTFLGYGGGYSFVEKDGWEKYSQNRYRNDPKELASLLDGVDILLAHQLSDDKETLRNAIEDRITPPKIVLSGHTHEHGVEFYGRTMYASCGPILPLDTRSAQVMGKSSFGILEIEGNKAIIELYFFKKDKVELDAQISINFNNH